MATDEKLRWLEVRINSSLQPRSDDLKNMMVQGDNRLTFHNFLNNEDVRHLYVFMKKSRQIEATLQPPVKLESKCIFFLKRSSGIKLTKDNIDSEVIFMDCSNLPLEHLELTIREVFLPLLASNSQTNGGDIMDVLHRLMATVEVYQGLVEGNIILSLPSIEVLAEAAATPSRRVSVLHVLETTFIGWIKQIKGVLRHNALSQLQNQFGKEACVFDEIHIWEKYLAQIQSINEQLDSPVAKDILQNLENANSQYAHSFKKVRKEITKAESETSKVLKFLSTLDPWYHKLHTSQNPQSAIKLFKPLLRVLQLIWTHSSYYHQMDKFHHLLRLLSNKVVHVARAMVGEDILKEPLESHSKLKEALRMCAAFRGAYLDFKDIADDQNAKKIAEAAKQVTTPPQGTFYTPRMQSSHAHLPFYGVRLDNKSANVSVNDDDDLWTDSPWPARNASCFDLLNNFMERCNDVLELIETIHHFRILSSVAIEGVGNSYFDATVNEIQAKFTMAVEDFFSQVNNVLNLNNPKIFDLAFFNLRTTIKSLEKAVSELLKFALEECPMVHSQLRLLEVFEGISGRDLVQAYLENVDKSLINNFHAELEQVKDIFQTHCISPPCHYNMPQSISKLMWVRGLKERIKIPLEKMKKVSQHYLQGERGSQIMNLYGEIMQDLEKYEVDIISKWKTDIVSELAHKLKQPLLIAEDCDDDTDVRPKVVYVNLDTQLLILLKEIHYLSKPPFSISLPESASEMMKNVDTQELMVTATRLETIVSKYNSIMGSITSFEHPMFERKLEQIDKLLEQGLQYYTWKMTESSDFIESATSLICLDVYQTLNLIQTNFNEIVDMTFSWSNRTLDIFSARKKTKSYTMDDLVNMHRQLSDEFESVVVPAGNTIHNLVQQSFEVVQISQASPAWKDYLDYIDAIVLDGIKQTTLISLKAMLNTMVETNFQDAVDNLLVPMWTIRLELIEDNLTFCPPLDQSTSVVSLQELVQTWLQSYVDRGKLIKMFGPKGSYEDFISVDEDVKQLVSDVIQNVSDTSQACKLKLLDTFKVYSFLWTQDVKQAFEQFLNGFMSPNPLHTQKEQRALFERETIQPSPNRSEMTSIASRVSSAKSGISEEIIENAKLHQIDSAESPQIQIAGSPQMSSRERNKVSSLDQFQLEINIYKTARDEILEILDYYDEGWIRVDLKPIKQVLTTYASKWMWTFTKYLSDQVTLMLETLDTFLARIEPEIESITGEERDTASFMKMMRLFNEVSAQQSEMDEKFAAMHKTVLLLKKYGQILPEKSQFYFSAAPGRWNNLKTKVSLAKQRLGPRIQEGSAIITKDLESFATRLTVYFDDLRNSKVYQRDCTSNDANKVIEIFSERYHLLEKEAQDLRELQELLETSVVNFSLLPIYQSELLNLQNLWQTIRIIREQHEVWNGHRWQKLDTKFLTEETDKQMVTLQAHPYVVYSWDVYIGIHESITAIQACLPLIDNLSNPAMRTRHWKQLVRVTGGAVIIDSDTLKKMTLKELLDLGLQHHVDDVRAIVQRATKDLDIENTLKTSEEVWLSKVFDLQPHLKNKDAISSSGKLDKRNGLNLTEIARPLSSLVTKNTRSASHISEHSFQSKNQRNSIISLPASFLNLEEEPATVMLLTNTENIFEELEHHQLKLQALQLNTAAGSFLDEVLKWHKKLQIIETVLQTWLEVQDKWIELEEVYSRTDICQSLSQDSKRFEIVNKDFKQLMGATEKNPNVLQCCSRKNILKILENMNRNLETCCKTLLQHLERKREAFPRFYLLSIKDVFHIVCSGNNFNVLNIYINKLLDNVGSLLYEEVNNEKYNFVISGITDVLNEKLKLDKSVCCEGPIETWLSNLIHQIKVTLQSQLALALTTQQPFKLKSREIQSAGARRVSIPLEGKDKIEDELQSEKPEEKAQPSAPIIMRSNYDENQDDLKEDGEKSVIGSEKENVWIGSHVAEILHLATHIQMTSHISKALEEFQTGNKKALKETLRMIDSVIDTTVKMLKDLKWEESMITNEENEKLKWNTLSHQREHENGGELDISMMRSSIDKSILNVVRESSYLSPNVDGEMKSRISNDETSAAAPLDTLSLILPIPGGGRASSIGYDHSSGQDGLPKISERKVKAVKQTSFPSQIHKHSSQIILMAQFRDLIKRLISVSKSSSPVACFDWNSQFKYVYNEEIKTTSVKCMKAQFEYGFEYLGVSEREAISPLTDKVFATIAQAIHTHMGVVCLGSKNDKSEIVHEMSRCLGRPMYMYNCNMTTDYTQIQNVFKGMALSGCWVCFNNISFMSPACLSLVAQLMSVIADAMKAGMSMVHLQSEDIKLSNDGACFGLMKNYAPVMSQDTDKLLIFPSAACQLPDTILNQFRVISLTKPDYILCVEVLLLSQAFVSAKALARKINQLFEIIENMFGTNSNAPKETVMDFAQSTSISGWSLQSIKRIIKLAGLHLEKTKSQSSEQSEALLVDNTTSDQENMAIIKAFNEILIPRMAPEDISLFSVILADLWPNTKYSLPCKKDKDSLDDGTSSVPVSQIQLDHSLPSVVESIQKVKVDIDDAIDSATSDLELLLSDTFKARIKQLSQLSTAYQSIIVVGSPGCGKSEVIKTFAVTEKKCGKQIIIQNIFINALEDRELLGYFSENTREWKDGLLTALLKKFCFSAHNSSHDFKDTLKILQLDGECDGTQMELLHSILDNNKLAILANNERTRIPETIRFIWELHKLDNMSPSFLATSGVMVMSSSDVGWQLMLMQWLEHRHGSDKEILKELCLIYINQIVDNFINCTEQNTLESGNRSQRKSQQFKRVIAHSIFNMVFTLTKLLEVLVNPLNDLSSAQYERYINYSAIWAFGGTLTEEQRHTFSDWWKEQFGKRINLPIGGSVFDYVVSNETHDFCKWSDLVPSYTGAPNIGILQDAFVHTIQTEQLLHLLGLLTDAGKSVMLVGGNGCGKTAVIKERIHAVCSGEVSDVLSLTVNANRFTNGRLLFDRLDKMLEWKHGKSYVPHGNKKLLCMVDDINLSQIDAHGHQTACELVREHLDDGGFYNYTNYTWRYVKNVTYVTSVNPQTTANVPALNPRLLRHFVIFNCPDPSVTELQTIFSTLLSAHFLTSESSGSSIPVSHQLSGSSHKDSGSNIPGPHQQSGSSHRDHNSVGHKEQTLQATLLSVVKVTVELFQRLCSMFLPTSQRCHYIFTTRDIGNIFRNVCLSLRPNCSKRNLFLLWQHECFWVCGKRMVNEVDFKRFRQAFVIAVKKEFIEDAQINAIIKRCPPLFSNLIEQDGGLVTAGINHSCINVNISEEDAKTDLYCPSKPHNAIIELLQKGLDEYNKVHPSIRLVLYKSVVEQLCRLSRLIASPHEVAHTVLVAEGCPGRCSTVVKFAASLCCFNVLQATPTSPQMSTASKIECFKTDLVSGYTRAGTKKDKVLLLLHEEELADKDCLVFLTDFIVSGAITHLFSQEEQATIINSIRTDVTQAGLTYTRDVAWKYFLRTVHKNFRIIFITSGRSDTFQNLCREYPSFIKNANFIWFPHWTKTQLIENTMFHLKKDVSWMNDVQKENTAHMLASMHLVMRQQDGGEMTNGEYAHLNNTTYEAFVERFISLANIKYAEVNKTQDAVTKTLTQIRQGDMAEAKLKKQLEHEMVVLEERKAGTVKILSQIGQDTAISEQQIKIINKHLVKVIKMKKRLPEYQGAHERAVYKVIAIVADAKKVVKLMNITDLAELRAMQKPAHETEDLLAAVIMLLKSPSADLTWQKGAKRQMANLERFVEELSTFDDFELPESTLVLVEAYLKNPSFDPEEMVKTTNNSACGALCKWVFGVVRYHRMMISKVRPLHKKVEETAQAMDTAQHKMNTLESKRKALEYRLTDLAKSFEEATIDKNEQEKKTVNMKKMLDTSAQLKIILNGERQRCQQIFDSFHHRQRAISGGCAMAAAFATYLGAYHHNFRRAMLTVHWPECLKEQGIPLVIDSIDSLKGRVVEWYFPSLKRTSEASSILEVDYVSLMKYEDDDYQLLAEHKDKIKDIVGPEEENLENEEEGYDEMKQKDEKMHGKVELGKLETDIQDNTLHGNTKPEEKEQTETSEKYHETAMKTSETTKQVLKNDENVYQDEEIALETLDELPMLPKEEYFLDEEIRSEATASSMPVLTSSQYSKYMKALIKILVGEITLNQWQMKDIGPEQIENAAILFTSWQRNPLMIDPNNEGSFLLRNLNKDISKSGLITLDMENRSDPQFVTSLENAIIKGRPVLLMNCGDSVSSMITPLLNHCNSVTTNDEGQVSQVINFYGHNINCHKNFKLYLATSLAKPLFNSATASSVTLINCGTSHEMFAEDLLTRAFALIRPELYQERKRALKNLQLQKDALFKFSEDIKDYVLSSGQEFILNSPKALQAITNIIEAKILLASQMSSTQAILDDLDILKDELYPLARRGSLMYSLVRSLASLRPAYQFRMKYFLELFDEAIGMNFPEEFFNSRSEELSQDTESDDGGKEMKQATDASTFDVDSSLKQEGIKQNDNNEKENVGADNTEKEIINKLEERPSLERTETEESVNSSAFQGLVHETEPEELPTIELPNTTSLPSDDVEYTSYPIDKVKQHIDCVTSLVYQKIKRSLLEEDRLLFSTLMLLCMKVEAGEDISNEELSFFLQGNPGLGIQLTIEDFDNKATAPQWLSKEKWEDILAISVLPGPMDNLCVDFALHSHQWKEWYESPWPETLQLPFEQRLTENYATIRARTDAENNYPREDDPDAGARSSNGGCLNDFHKLLILRILRPDRLPSALLHFSQSHFNIHDPDEESFNINEVLSDSKKHWGVLVLLPLSVQSSSDPPASRIKLIKSPIQEIEDLANVVKIPVIKTVIHCGSEASQIQSVIDTAEKCDGWSIIESIHLSTPTILEILIQHLQRIHKKKANLKTDKEKETSKFCVWLTSESCDSLPALLVQNLLKVSWNAVLNYSDKIIASETNDLKNNETEDTFNIELPDTYLKASIVSTLQLIPKSVLEILTEKSAQIKRQVFAVIVMHAILVSRQLFGCVGLILWYPFGTTQLLNAIEAATSYTAVSSDNREQPFENLHNYITNIVYCPMVSDESDRDYIRTLSINIFKSIFNEQQTHISFGGALIPIPADSVVPTNYADWFEQTADDKTTLKALQMMTAVEKYINNCCTSSFFARLNCMFKTFNMEAGEVSSITSQVEVSIAKLRSALDICLELLPQLLDLGEASSLLKLESDSLYNNQSFNNPENHHLQNSIGYVILQECICMNKLIYQIKQDINDLQSNLIGGSVALPRRLLSQVYCLQEEQVPFSWVHPNSQPCIHSLIPWLEDLNKRHNQLDQFVHCDAEPKITCLLPEPQGRVKVQMKSVWLGGLVSPQALLTAIRREKANLAAVSLSDVNFECVIMKEADQVMLEEDGFIATDIFLENASWDFDTNTIKESDDTGLTCLKAVYLKPVVKEGTHNEGHSNQEQFKEEGSIHNGNGATLSHGVCDLPVYMNKSRQVQVYSLSVKCHQSVEKYILARAAFLLNPGMQDGGVKKSKAYLMMQRLPPSKNVNQEKEETSADEEENKMDDEDDNATYVEDSEEESNRSQLSFLPVTSKFSPLPEELKLQREEPIFEHETQQRKEEDESVA